MDGDGRRTEADTETDQARPGGNDQRCPGSEGDRQEADPRTGPGSHATGIVFTVVNVKIRLGPTEAFREATPYRIETELGPVVLVRIGDDFYALEDRCSHQNVPLSEGEVYGDSRELECYKHGSTFSLETGEALILPATKPVPTFDVSVENGQVTLSLD